MPTRRSTRSAEAGSPPILSISSRRNSGFEVLTLCIDWMILPGIEAT
jgi:hypothetical protein